MRYECDEPGFEGAFVEFRPAGWTRAHLRDLRTLDEGEAWFAVLRSRMAACHLPVVEGQPATEPAHLTTDLLDRLDLVLYNWVVTAVVRAIGEVTTLGNAPWRRLSNGSAATAATTPPTP